jgi:H+-translocating NAD(P) transhydrogenase subunit alpha
MRSGERGTRNEVENKMIDHEEQGLKTKYQVQRTEYQVRSQVRVLIPLAVVLLFARPLVAEPTGAGGTPTTATASDWPAMLFVFMLASFIGLGVITRVSRLLHTPLMSLTNAISAIAIVGAIAVAGGQHALPITLLGAIALFASTTNIVSGFLITDRMLKMFKRQERKQP